MSRFADSDPALPSIGRDESRPYDKTESQGNGHQMRHRRSAERRQIDAFQRADQGGHRGSQLPVLHDRSEHRRRACARSAPRGALGDRQAAQDHSDVDRVRRHRRTGRWRVERRGARQQVPRAHSRGRRDRARRALLRKQRHHPRRRQDRSDLGYRDDRYRTCARRSRVGRQGAEQGRTFGQGQRQGGAGQAPGAAEARCRAQRRQVGARRGTRCRRESARARPVPADAQAADVHRQRQGGRVQ